MKKYEPMKKDLSADIDVRRLGEEPLSFHLEANADQLAELQELYEIVDLRSYSVEGEIMPGDPVVVCGTLKADMDRTCVVTGEVFHAPMDETFILMFSETPDEIDPKTVDIDLDGEPVEAIRHHRIFLKEPLMEQFGLNLSPFPKKTTEVFKYIDEDVLKQMENPFAVLKQLKKEE